MSLQEYSKKRSFGKTPEPPPSTPPNAAGNRFCVQRHHARRLHYDFRVEVGGTLKSWAVPQGPSLKPGDKRLAVMVEDHPLDYGDFEGNIPAGNYGAGSVMLWDRGIYELLGGKSAAEQLDRGDFKFRLYGQKLQGEFALVRMKNRGKGNEWLLLKKRDPFADPVWDIDNHGASVKTGRTQEEIAREMPARAADAGPALDLDKVPGAVAAPMPASIAPMLAELAKSPPRGQGWIYEIKWDGVRALCYLDDGGLRIYSRNGNAMARQYPELSVLPHFVRAHSAVLDGEIAALDEAGRPSFSRIQPRIMASDANAIAQLSRSRPVVLFVFDLLYLDGYDLRQTPLAERKRLLAAILNPGPVIRRSDHFEGDASGLLEAARAQGLEGLVAKRASSLYEGRRSREWLKIKITRDGEFVLCGFTEGERDYFGALALGIHRRGRLEFAGCVGTGFDRKQMEGIHRLLEPLGPAPCPFAVEPSIPQKVTWVRPEKVCTVRFHSWTDEERLRAPVFVGLRPDIDPRESTSDPAPPDSSSEPPPAGLPERPPLLDGKRTEATLILDGRRLQFRHLDKIYYPREGYPKRDVLNYYDAIASLILPHLKDRPLSLRRYPDGIHNETFFQKDASTGFPAWLRTEDVTESDGRKVYALCQDRPSLIYIANLGCIDQNPWMSRVTTLDHPDFMLIDLDPQGCPYSSIVEAALLIRRKLETLGLAGYPKTTGGDGMHIYVPLEPVYSYEQARTFAEILARVVAGERPDLFTTPRPVARREKGKVYFDYLQISRGKTISAPYVLRAHDGAPVATPLDWSELTPSLGPSQFHIRNAVERFRRVGDLFAGVLSRPQRLETAIAKLEALVRR